MRISSECYKKEVKIMQESLLYNNKLRNDSLENGFQNNNRR